MSLSNIPNCAVIHTQEIFVGKQGLTYFAGISAQSAGAQGICLHMLTLPPGGRGYAHLHEHHETAIYIISGQAEMWYGESPTSRGWGYWTICARRHYAMPFSAASVQRVRKGYRLGCLPTAAGIGYWSGQGTSTRLQKHAVRETPSSGEIDWFFSLPSFRSSPFSFF
jgi:hypothetical protein